MEHGQAATLRGLEILKGLGCDVRILQMEGAKDPDEYVIKYGTGRFNLLIDNAISLVEFKVKVLKDKFDLENTNDKIKFLQEIAKILSMVESQIELEIYIDKIAKEYVISKEAIYSEIKKIKSKDLEKNKENNVKVKPKMIKKESNIDEATKKKENLIIYLILNYDKEITNIIRSNLIEEDFKFEINKNIIKKIYELIDTGKSTLNILDYFEDEETINHLTMLMADDYEITDVNKCIDDIINSYNKDRLINRRNEILQLIDNEKLTKEEIATLETELSNIIIKLAKIK
ncbi:MAG: hypothetical protein HFJ43_04970 [Clostridia bacterium]|nr:hypothetical protein [Clostridia bacterium]